MLKLLYSILGTSALALLATEFHEGAGWLSSRIVLLAAKRLPERLRKIRREEWLAELEAFESLCLLKLLWSVGVYVAAIKLQFRYHGEIKAERGCDGFFNFRTPVDSKFVLRPHPATLILPAILMVSGLMNAVIVTVMAAPTASSTGIEFWWAIGGLTVLLMLWRAAGWAVDYIAICPSEILLIKGIVRRRLRKISIPDVQSLRVERSFFGRICAYGTLVITKRCGCTYGVALLPYPQEVMDELGELIPTY